MGFDVETKKILLSRVLVCTGGIAVRNLKRVVRVAARRRTALKYVGIRRDVVSRSGKACASTGPVNRNDLHAAAVNLTIVQFQIGAARSACAMYREQCAACWRIL